MNDVMKRTGTEGTLEKLMELNLQTAGNVNAISQQLGIISSKVDTLGLEVANVKDRMQSYEDAIRVSRSQADTIRRAIHARACELLGIRYKDGIVEDGCLAADTRYRSGFLTKAYSDARKYSFLGTPYYETARKDYVAVLDYINDWVPQAGVEGYKRYLDERKRARGRQG